MSLFRFTKYLSYLAITLVLLVSTATSSYGKSVKFSNRPPIARNIAQIDDLPLKHIFWDVDWTILDKINDLSKVKDHSQIFTYEGEHYRFIDQLGAMFLALKTNLPNLTHNIITGGTAERNPVLLDELVMPGGESVAVIMEHVFSKEHLVKVSTDKNLRFFERYKKMLEPLLPNYDSKNTVLVDDLPGFTDYGEASSEKNKLAVFNSYGRDSYFETIEDYLEAITSEVVPMHTPKNKKIWRLGRNRAALFYGVLEYAYIESEKGSGDFADLVVEAIMDDSKTEYLTIDDPRLFGFFERGMEVLAKFSGQPAPVKLKKRNRKSNSRSCKVSTGG